jgi:outer membrane protein OmpA-like peptidoglycan-associated protein
MLKQVTLALAAFVIVAVPGDAHGQGMMERMKKRAEEAAKRKVEQRVDQRAGEATDAALDKVECAAATRRASTRRRPTGSRWSPAGAARRPRRAPRAGAASAAGAGAAGTAALKPGQGAWANYDFKPGDRVLFADDFSQEQVGNFPRRLEFVSGSMDLVEWQGKRWVSAANNGELHIPLPQTLPEQFTVEFDLAGSGNAMYVTFDGKSTYHRMQPGRRPPRVRHLERRAALEPARRHRQHRLQDRGGAGQGAHRRRRRLRQGVRQREARLERAEREARALEQDLHGAQRVERRQAAHDRRHRVAAGGKKLYDAIAEKGRVATQGIYFDTGSDRIRPESSPTLKEIGTMLSEHPELKLAIEGHTDNVGSADANMSLSQKRADAVKAALVASYGVDAARLTAKGLGASKPAVGNDTPAGRQQNRRVELAKM